MGSKVSQRPGNLIVCEQSCRTSREASPADCVPDTRGSTARNTRTDYRLVMGVQLPNAGLFDENEISLVLSQTTTAPSLIPLPSP